MPLYEYFCPDCENTLEYRVPVECRDTITISCSRHDPIVEMKRKIGNISNFSIDGKAYTQGVDWARKAGVTRGDVL